MKVMFNKKKLPWRTLLVPRVSTSTRSPSHLPHRSIPVPRVPVIYPKGQYKYPESTSLRQFFFIEYAL